MFLEAQDDLLQLTQKQKDAAYELVDAEAALAEARSGAGKNDVPKAESDYEQSIIDSAKAAADLRKALAENSGEIVDASDYAKMFGEELEKAIEGMPIDASIKRLEFMIALLKKVPELPTSDIDELSTNDLTEGFASKDPMKGLEPPNKDKYKGAWDEFTDNFVRGLKMLPGTIGKALVWVGKGIFTVINKLFLGIVGGVAFLLGLVGRAIVGAVVGIFKLLTDTRIWRDVDNWIKDLPGILGRGVASIGKGLWNIGGNIIKGILSGLRAAWDGIWGWVSSVIKTFIDWFKKGFGINSPSTVMMAIGKYIIEGMKNGIVNFWDNTLWPFISGIPGKILGVFVGAATWLFNAGVSVVGGIWDGLKNGWETVKEWFGSLKEMILGIFSGAGDWLKDVGKQIVSGLMDVVIKVWDKIPSVVRSKIPGIKEIDKMIQDYKELTGVKGELTKAVGTAMSKVPAASKYNGNDARMQTMARETMEATPSSWFAPKGTKTLGGLPTAPVNTTTTYNLNAITTADPKEIMNEFAWAESIRTRGSS